MINIFASILTVVVFILFGLFCFRSGREYQKYLDDGQLNIKKVKYEKRDKESNRFCQ